ncbi:MAG: UDP-N-acetylglucosamine 2-epimerase (non-hydrolyzing) [Planctomycetota bacterium]
MSEPGAVGGVMVVAGTRPEAIKVAPVVLELARRRLPHTFLVTAQHRELLDTVVELFGLRPDVDLDIMKPGQHPGRVLSEAIAGIDRAIQEASPRAVLVQGDTVTALSGALAAFHRQIPVGHIEAGLRSGDLEAPFPEEGSRRMIGQVARYHYVPTANARRNLLAEGIPEEWIHDTGNTIVDSLLWVKARVRLDPVSLFGEEGDTGRRLVLVTLHRRESLGNALSELAGALARVADAMPEVVFVVPLHPNPAVGEAVRPILGGRDNVRLRPAMAYDEFVAAMARACLIVTDSGGIQEEAPSLGVQALVVRDKTERVEAIEAGWATLIGRSGARLEAELRARLTADGARAMPAGNPFGDGRAATRIVDQLEGALDIEADPQRTQ